MTEQKVQELIPPDIERCQAEITQGSFMTLGPRSAVRCHNKPTWIATETIMDKEGRRGSMSLCNACRDVMLSMGIPATFKEIKPTVF